jgi:hypothetical protein
MTYSVQNNYSVNNTVHNQYSAKAENGHKKNGVTEIRLM